MASAACGGIRVDMGNFDIKTFANDRELAQTVAGAWLLSLEQEKSSTQPCLVALSGGRITKQFFSEIVRQANGRTEFFSRVHFFWADERCVPPNDPESNFIIADELLFKPLKISAANIHRLRGEIDSAQ